MDSFEEFRQNLNEKPKTTRSSLIEPQVSRPDAFSKKNNSTCDVCRRQARFSEPENIDFEIVRERGKKARTELQKISEDPSIQYFPRTPFDRIYNSSGKPLHLSDFRNEEHFPNNNYENRTYGQSDSWISQANGTSNLRDNEFVPYDDFGRTFNLTEFAENNSNNLQNLTKTNDTFIPNLNNSKKKQRRTHNTNSNRLTYLQIPSESLKNSCREFCQLQQTEHTAIPRRIPELKYGRMESMRPLKPITRKNPLFENFVKDSYFPGIIVDTVNGVIDFNKIIFETVFGCGNIPFEIEQKSVPMSVLEAFDLRIEYEQNLRKDLETRKVFCSNELKNEQRTKSRAKTEDEKQKNASEKATYWIHRDELKLASTIDIDLMTKVENFPETPLTEAINCLLKAEKMNNFDRNVYLAEEAIRTASDGQEELAALKSTCSFKLELRKDEIKATNTYEPLAIISYIGTTKPNDE